MFGTLECRSHFDTLVCLAIYGAFAIYGALAIYGTLAIYDVRVTDSSTTTVFG